MASRYAIDTTGVERFASLLGNSDEIKAAAEEQRRQEALAQAYNRARLESERAQGQQYGLENERLAGRNQALSELTQAFLQMGMENPEAHATLIRASENIDPAKLGDYMTDYATRQQRGGAIDAYQGGDTGLANMLLAAGGRDPVQQTEVQGDVAFNPNIGPSQPMQPTPAFTAELAQNARQPVDYTPLNG
ncbi:MAG TPA: hypothetical protein VFP95_02435, partial [Gammaproteobacteria bacterium]|nr:hypothetical protein [Gammaproteobacteria bacterium]